ncbi:MAG: NAD(P)/FAD-dependent oxidoreductase [Myxococcales bacterium]|nr:NAD(P)/FAD-dependent oxidoreductase [Myxococcales bacterium]
MRADYDVIVCGGGLAGLTLAYQLRKEIPDASVAVIERQARPLPEAAHKVGESSVELASHYFGEVLGLRPYLLDNHLKKNGLRFICGDTQGPLEERPEIGPSEFPIVPSYQLDRGKLENDLRAMLEERGVALLEGPSVRDITLAQSEDEPHVVHATSGDLSCRWVVDATGRRRLLQKKLGYRRESPNRSSSAWFRVRQRVLVGELVPKDRAEWHQRDVDKVRWLSTVHLMGRGYWVWLIPLSTGYTSIGIVAETEHHPFDTFHKPELALAWLAKHEPRLMERIDGLELEDFRVVRDYSYLTDRFASADRWSCVGEAAAFVDPLYSLGSDFISMSNSYTTRLVGDYLRGALDRDVLEELNENYCRLARDAARTLSNNGRIFPHGDVMGAKLWWDFFNYWSFMCAHFFQEIWRQDAATLRRFRSMQARYYELNSRAQSILESWAALKPTAFGGPKGFVGLPSFPSTLADAHLELSERRSVEETFAKMERDLETGRQLVTEILAHALRDLGSERAAELGRLAGLSSSWDLPLGGERFAADALPRRQRVDALPRIARDMERALGRVDGDLPLSALLDLALAAPAVAVAAPTHEAAT